jgi:hypothetical protein
MLSVSGGNMNLRRRITITRIPLQYIRVRTAAFLLAARLLFIFAKLHIALVSKFARWKTHLKVEALKKTADSLAVRNNFFSAECQAFLKAPIGGIRRQQLLATYSVLQAESARIQAAVVELQSPRPIGGGITLWISIFESIKARFLRNQRSSEALRRIISQIRTSPNFYWDLLLWFVVPGGFVEDQIGDLNEEFLLRTLSDGEALANAWYRHQVVSSIVDHLWDKIERLIAIGTLIDWWFRR